MIVRPFNSQAMIPHRVNQSKLLQYVMTVLIVAAATATTYYIPGISERATVLFFVFAIGLAAFTLGYDAALTALFLSLVSVNGFILLPVWDNKPDEALAVNAGFFLVCSIVIAIIKRQLTLSAVLQLHKQELDRIQAIGQIGSWRLDIRQNKFSMSDEVLRIYGLSHGSTLTYKAFLASVHPEDSNYVDGVFKSGVNAESYELEHRIIVDGEIKWVRERIMAEFDSEGQYLGSFGTIQDFTFCKNTEQAYKESQQRFAHIIESAMDAIISVDINQRIILFNASAEKIFGFKSEEMIDKSIDIIIPERFRQTHKEHISTFALSSSSTRDVSSSRNVWGLRANGEEFPIEAAISQCEINGEMFFTAIIRDITEQLKTEKALNEKLALQDQFAKVAASVPGAICTFKLAPDGTASMPFVSANFENIYGLDKETVKEDFTPVFSRLHPDDSNRINELINKSANNLTPWHDSFRYEHPLKGEIWIEGHSVPQREDDGSILWHGYIQDITERKHAEQNIMQLNQSLKRRTEEMEVIFDTAPIGLSIADDPTGTHIRGNLTNEKMLGLPRGSELSKKSDHAPNIKSFQNKHELEIAELPMQRAIKGETISNFLMDICRPDGESITVLCNAAPILDEHGLPRGAVGAFLDVTESIKSKALTVLRGKIEQQFREQVVIQTAAMIAHQVNQPLTAITYYADAAVRILQSDPMQSQKLVQILEKCSQQAHRAGYVFKELTEFLNKVDITSEPIDINSCINEACNLVIKHDHLNGYEIKLDLAESLALVLANRLQVLKVLTHLIENGFEAMHEARLLTGMLIITSQRVAGNPAMAQVTIQDSSKCAFDTADLKKLFQPFYSTKPKGLGLGLAISRALIEANDGKLWVEQNDAAGLTFHFTLPFVS